MKIFGFITERRAINAAAAIVEGLKAQNIQNSVNGDPSKLSKEDKKTYLVAYEVLFDAQEKLDNYYLNHKRMGKIVHFFDNLKNSRLFGKKTKIDELVKSMWKFRSVAGKAIEVPDDLLNPNPAPKAPPAAPKAQPAPAAPKAPAAAPKAPPAAPKAQPAPEAPNAQPTDLLAAIGKGTKLKKTNYEQKREEAKEKARQAAKAKASDAKDKPAGTKPGPNTPPVAVPVATGFNPAAVKLRPTKK